MKRIVTCALTLLALTVAAGCASKKTDKPTPLQKISARIKVQRAWHASLGGEAPKLRLGLGVAADAERVFAASHKGEVEAFALQTGKRLWRRALKLPLSGGPAAGDGLVVVGSSKGDVVALSAADGTVRWRLRINAEILSAAAIGQDVVLIRGVDGSLHALSSKDGSENWVTNQEVPRLTLRGTSRPIFYNDLAICGYDDGHLTAVVRANGNTAWQAAVGESRGNTELARLIDVDATPVASMGDLFAVAYQGRVARVSATNGEIIWAHDLSSYRGLAVNDSAVFVSTADGDLVRLDRSTGAEQWRIKALERRQISAPALYHGQLVVGDLDGFVHWLDPMNGDFLARERDGKKRISFTPLVAGDLLLVFGDDGNLTAYRTPAPAVAAAPAGAAPAGAAPADAAPVDAAPSDAATPAADAPAAAGQ